MATINRAPPINPVGTYVNRVSTIGEFWFDPLTLSSDQAIREVLHRNKGVFAQHKHDCGQIPGEVLIEGLDPRPQRQYGFPRKEVGAVAKVIDSSLQQVVLRRVASTNNVPIWPVKKNDGSWRLTIDYRELNKVTQLTATLL